MSPKLSIREVTKSVKETAFPKGLTIIDSKERAETVELFIDAFKHDPMPQYIVGYTDTQDPTKEKYRDETMKYIFGWMNLDMLKQKNGIVLGSKENGQLVGAVSIIASKHDKKEGFFTIVRKLIQFGTPPYETKAAKEHFSPNINKRLERLEDVTTRRHQIMKEREIDRYIYIQQIGVKTAYQRKGIGGTLLRAIFEIATSTNSVCYLETETEENVSLYKHLGFQTVEQLRINVPGDDAVLTMYCMLRN